MFARKMLNITAKVYIQSERVSYEEKSTFDAGSRKSLR